MNAFQYTPQIGVRIAKHFDHKIYWGTVTGVSPEDSTITYDDGEIHSSNNDMIGKYIPNSKGFTWEEHELVDTNGYI